MRRSEDRILHLEEEFKIDQTSLRERKRSFSMILIVMSRISKIMAIQVSTVAISTMITISHQKAQAKQGLKDRTAQILLTKCFIRIKIANNKQAARNNWRPTKKLIEKNLKFLNK